MRDEIALIASGYEWICPDCDTLNRINATSETVTCKECRKVFNVGETYHADGGVGISLPDDPELLADLEAIAQQCEAAGKNETITGNNGTTIPVSDIAKTVRAAIAKAIA